MLVNQRGLQLLRTCRVEAQRLWLWSLVLVGLFQAPGPTKPDPCTHHLPFEEIRLFFSPLLLVPENDLRKKINCITCKQSAQVTFCYSSSLRA